MKHLTQDELSAHLDGALAASAAAQADRHLAECEVCRNALASLAGQDQAIRPVLEHDPGDAYFDTFAARVEDRIRAAGLRGAQSRSLDEDWLSWLRSPRRLATVGALAAVIGGAAIVIVTARMERPQPSVLLDRPSAQTAPAPATDDATLEAVAPEAVPAPAAKGAAANRSTREGLALPTEPEAKEVLAREETSAPEAQTRSTLSSRAQAAPRRTDLGGATGSTDGFAPPPSAPSAPSDADAKRVATRRAEPAQETRALARDEAAQGAKPMGEGSQLCGRVVNAQGNPVRHAVVALTGLGVTATTNEDGRFCLQAPAGTHEVTVLAVGYRESRLQAMAAPGAEVQVRLQPVPVLEGPTAGNMQLYKQNVTDPFAGSPARVQGAVREARSLATKAQASGSAAQWDAAAARWQRIVPSVTGAALQEARFRHAEARFHAWQAGANATRMRAANDALVEFLRYASTGPQRDQAASWLARLLR